MKRKILGIDIGGTNLRGAVITDNGDIIARRKVSSNAGKGIDQLIDTLTDFIEEFDKHEIDGLGIGIPGIIDQKKGILTQAPNIAGVKNYPLRKNLLKKLSADIPIVIENDANCAALGEFWMGAGESKISSMIMLTIGTGLGGGIILDGKLWTGEDGMGGEIGHMTINSDGPLCNCGNSGCIESYVSAEALRRIVDDMPRIKNKLSKVNKEDIPEALTELASSGDNDALDIWKELGKNLGVGIASLANILNMEMVVIGGGISNAWNYFIKDTKNEISKRGLKAPAERLKIRKAVLGDDAGIFGACYLAMKKVV